MSRPTLARARADRSRRAVAGLLALLMTAVALVAGAGTATAAPAVGMAFDQATNTLTYSCPAPVDPTGSITESVVGYAPWPLDPAYVTSLEPATDLGGGAFASQGPNTPGQYLATVYCRYDTEPEAGNTILVDVIAGFEPTAAIGGAVCGPGGGAVEIDLVNTASTLSVTFDVVVDGVVQASIPVAAGASMNIGTSVPGDGYYVVGVLAYTATDGPATLASSAVTVDCVPDTTFAPEVDVAAVTCTFWGGTVMVTFDNSASDVYVEFEATVDGVVMGNGYMPAGVSEAVEINLRGNGTHTLVVTANEAGGTPVVLHTSTVAVACDLSAGTATIGDTSCTEDGTVLDVTLDNTASAESTEFEVFVDGTSVRAELVQAGETLPLELLLGADGDYQVVVEVTDLDGSTRTIASELVTAVCDFVPVYLPAASVGAVACNELGGYAPFTLSNDASNVRTFFEVFINGALDGDIVIEAGDSFGAYFDLAADGAYRIEVRTSYGGAATTALLSRTVTVDCVPNPATPPAPGPGTSAGAGPTLPATGSDAQGLLTVSGLLLLVGTGLVVQRRRVLG